MNAFASIKNLKNMLKKLRYKGIKCPLLKKVNIKLKQKNYIYIYINIITS